MAHATLAHDTSERLRELCRCLEVRTGFIPVVEALQRGEAATVEGVWGSSCALAAAAFLNKAPGLLVLVCPHQDDIDEVCEDLRLFTSQGSIRFPAWESDPGERILHDEIYGDRLRALKLLAGSEPPRLLVTSIQSLLQAVPPRQAIADGTRRIQTGNELELDELLRWLVERGFHGSSAVELPGEFSVRGGILDIFAPDWREPARIELFDRQVDSIRRFDVASQRSLETLTAVDVTVLRPTSGEAARLTDFLPPSSWIMLIEPTLIEEEARQYLSRQQQPQRQQLHSYTTIRAEIARFGVVLAAGLAGGATRAACNLHIESVERFSGEIGRVREELDRVGRDQELHVVVPTEAEIERLREILGGTQLAARGRLHFSVGSLRAGFRLLDEQIIVVAAHELFLRGEVRRLPRRRLGKAIDSFLELREGDLVVHLAHGIGRYRGLTRIDKDGHVEDHLEVEFHGRTKVYVPSSKIELVQKYVGGTKSRPSLAKIGGKTWLRQKQAAAAAVTDLASEMLEMQAARASQSGISFGPDSDWQREFDASFPYQETPDQLTALSAIKLDMQAPRPMDRLLCGDVGFGKTELAMRATFKAVDMGYQVALLAPTTILVEQHYRTFQQRMAEFPFDIAKLSRFCSAAEQRETIKRLAGGQVDIVIGTHRLASSDVRFHNLGLVIIDEEQRFGVEVKERLKTLRNTVDVLTLTATPIPRTLHMSLVGVRDISNLETPPEDRLAVETRVARWSDKLIRHAVLRELNRGGQIYFVHNRVQDIELVARRLRFIVPELDLRIGHGQMGEGELEEVMVDFVAGRFDMLLATTIVESGLDIPNANTMFIDEADRYGLADMHQLRGRVGRYKHRAYCYLLLDPGKMITPNAAKRLRAIEEFSDMGAGFAISMRDLEIRGAGNLLGTQQSGHIAAVGYELYCQLLEQAVRRLRRLPPRLSVDVELDLPGEAYLPDDYVADMRSKIDLYRRLTSFTGAEQVAEFRAELGDRFGPPPDTAERLLSLAELRIDAAVWQISSIHQQQRDLVFRYTDRRRVEQLAQLSKGRLRVVDDRYAYLRLPHGLVDPDAAIELAKSVLQLP